MAEQTLNLPQIIAVVLVGFLAIRWFMSSSSPQASGSARGQRQINPAHVEQVHQMFPQLDRRTIAWDLQQNGGSVQATTERVLGGRALVQPPPSFQPQLPASPTAQASGNGRQSQAKTSAPDLISRYNLSSRGARANSKDRRWHNTSSTIDVRELLHAATYRNSSATTNGESPNTKRKDRRSNGLGNRHAFRWCTRLFKSSFTDEYDAQFRASDRGRRNITGVARYVVRYPFSGPITDTKRKSMAVLGVRMGPTHDDSLEGESMEFPSLSGGPQAHNQNPMSQAWNSNALRQSQTPQQSSVQRPTPQTEASRQQQAQQQAAFGFGSNLDGNFENRATAPSPPDSNPNQQSGGADDFPPLGGGLNGDVRPDRTGGIPGAGLVASAFGGQVNGQVDGESFGAAATDGLRSPIESRRTPSNPLLGQQQLPFREGAFPNSRQAPVGQPNAAQQSQQGMDFASQMVESPSSIQQPAQARRRLSQLNDSEKWGLPGLLAMLPGHASGSPGIIMGQDLNSLGIDFESTEPLFPTFSTPFADASSRPAIPDFSLPAAYSVHNVPPLSSRIANFSDETLFAIFYQFTRDVMQEHAAAELYSRDWRWHKELRQWMMKDTSMAQPVRMTERSESGVYIFFDAMNWRRERRNFLLQYDHLDQRHSGPTQAGTA
ncbi:General negative regulator of transcription subunit 2-like protein [Elsinoe fawcettii]|nr:General negative regulator of transcription subunit 2-like protein [Elsinoe fawcettii]